MAKAMRTNHGTAADARGGPYNNRNKADFKGTAETRSLATPAFEPLAAEKREK